MKISLTLEQALAKASPQLRRYDAEIYSTDFSAYMSAKVSDEGVYFLNSSITADNIMDFEKV